MIRRACLALCLALIPALATAQPAPVTPGAYVDHAVRGTTVAIDGSGADARIRFVRPHTVRVDWLAPGQSPDSSFTVVAEPMAAMPDVVNGPDAVYVRSEALTVAVHKDPLRITFHDAGGRQLVAEADSNVILRDSTRTLGLHLDAGTHVYGTGERAPFGLRGTRFPVRNTQQYGYTEAPPVMKVNVPFVTTSAGYGLFIDNTYPGEFDVAASRADRLRYTAGGGALTYYVIAGSIQQQIQRYTALTGRQPMPPKWSLGYLQSKYGYRSEAETRGVVDSLRTKGFPVDAVILDLFWFKHMGDLAWDREAFPTPFQMMRELKAKGVKTVAITETFLVRPSRLFQPALDGGHTATLEDGAPFITEDWWSCEDGCDATLVDMTDPEAQAWWWSQHPEFMGETEMAGLWTDLGEPERHPDFVQHHLGPAPKVHNVYNLLWAQTLFENWRQWRPNERIFNLTRSGFAGMQRYNPTVWSGDVARTFSAFQDQNALILNMGLSGFGFYSSDLGGFTSGTTTPELYARWLQQGALTATMRPHGVNQPTEPWTFGPEVEAMVREVTHLRYRLMPYLYTLAWENHRTGLPLVRPLFFADEDDARLHGYDEAFLLGDALLVAPVLEDSARTKTVRLPEGTWIDWHTDRALPGDTTVTVDAPLDELPLFVKAGSIVPMRPMASHTGAQPADTLALHVYPNSEGVSAYQLYEDDGSSLAYQDGLYALTDVRQSWRRADGQRELVLDVSGAVGYYDGQPEARTLHAAVHRMESAPSSVTVNGTPIPTRASASAARTRGGSFYDSDTGVLHVSVRTAMGEAVRMVVGL